MARSTRTATYHFTYTDSVTFEKQEFQAPAIEPMSSRLIEKLVGQNEELDEGDRISLIGLNKQDNENWSFTLQLSYLTGVVFQCAGFVIRVG